MKKIIIVIGVLFLLLSLTITFVGGIMIGGVLADRRIPDPQVPAQTKASGDLKQVQQVMDEIIHAYVEKPNRRKLIDGAIDGMIKSLDDPYTRRLKPSDYGEFQDQTTGHFGGVGIELGIKDKQLTVVAPIKGTPADRAGVHAGDKIIKIDEKSTKGMALEQAVKLIRGKEGTKVTLTFERNGGKPFAKELVREQIKLPNVSSKVLDKNLGYIRVHAFNTDTTGDVRKQLDELKEKGIKGVIVDMRNNPGGLLNEAVTISSLFIKSGPIVKVKERSGKTETLTANNGADDKVPLVVLVNKGSASASEIFAGAIQDTGRGVIVGEKTFGKGSVQTVFPLEDGSGLVMTTAKYLTPKNRSLNKKGITPDVVIALPKIKPSVPPGKPLPKGHLKGLPAAPSDDDAQVDKAKEVLRDVIAGKSFKKAS